MRLTVAGLFAGIGGVERGLEAAGHSTVLLCDVDEAAQRVLGAHFGKTPLVGDVRELRSLGAVDLVTAGFPCQDLSQAGRMAGIKGRQSGVVAEVFRLLDQSPARWLLLENVSFMLHLDGGEAMAYLTDQLTTRGFRWAYRVVETRAFGLPQRRQRVLLLASREEDPRRVLLADDAGEPSEDDDYSDKARAAPLNGKACGFYWTEGSTGLGWAVDAVPTLKGGSTVGIPSPPAIVLPTGEIVTPDIRDAERLQGFPSDWTKPAVSGAQRRNGPRWKLVGNAVSVPVAEWVGRRLARPGRYNGRRDPALEGKSWPKAAWRFAPDEPIRVSPVSRWPEALPRTPLARFLRYEPQPLSLRAAQGFAKRARRSSLRFPKGLLGALDAHIRRLKSASVLA